jgi:glycosyltransferase 2 family protein
VLHGYDLRSIWSGIGELEWQWVSLCILCDLLVYVCHGWRWNLVLQPVQPLPLWRTVQAIYIGLFANEILPLRTGELIRCYLLAHWNNLLFSVAFASIALERLMDGIWMVGAFAVTASLLQDKIPTYVVDVVRMISVVLVLLLAIFLYVVFHKSHAHTVVRQGRWASTLRHVVDGLHLMGNWRTLSQAMGASLLYLLLQILSIWALMKAYQLDLSVWAGAAVLVVVRFATVIPNAPGNVGVFQWACVMALSKLFGVEKADATTFSILVFGAITLPLLVGGAVAVALTGLNLKEIHHRARKGLEASRQPATDDHTPAR